MTEINPKKVFLVLFALAKMAQKYPFRPQNKKY